MFAQSEWYARRVFLSVRLAILAGMMDNAEADNFRRIQLVSKVDRANEVIGHYRAGIDHYRRELNKFHKRLGHIAERLGEPEEGDHDDA
jgi:hypothetical protein